jgi:ankyrin repeat protein
MKRWLKGLLIVGIAAIAVPATAQDFGTGSDGEAFIKAVREEDNAKALELLNGPGTRLVNYRSYQGETALHIAVQHRDLTWVRYLLGKKADANIGNREGDTPLILAARTGFVEAADYMLQFGANPDATNRMGETALIVAVQQRQAAVVRKLLENGANPDKADHAAGFSARDYARRDNRNTELLKLIETVQSKKKKAVAGPKL